MRAIDISYQVIEPVREMIAIGEEVRYIDQHGIMFVVFNRRICKSAINAEVKRISLNGPSLDFGPMTLLMPSTSRLRLR